MFDDLLTLLSFKVVLQWTRFRDGTKALYSGSDPTVLRLQTGPATILAVIIKEGRDKLSSKR